MKEAKTNCMLKRDRRKMERESLKYGQPRPIYQELIAEIVDEHEKKEREYEAARSRELSWLPSEMSRLRGSRLNSIQGLRPKSASGSIAMRQSRRAAGIVLSKESSSILKSTTNDTSYDGEVVVMKPSDMVKKSSRAVEKLYKHLSFSEHLDGTTPGRSLSNQQLLSSSLRLEIIPGDTVIEEGGDDYARDEAMDDIDIEPEVAVRLLMQRFDSDISRKPDSYDSTSTSDILPLFLQSNNHSRSNSPSGRNMRNPAFSSFSIRDTKILKARQARDEQEAARETRSATELYLVDDIQSLINIHDMSKDLGEDPDQGVQEPVEAAEC